MKNKFKLDSCTKVNSTHFEFIYDGIQGTYNRSELCYNGKLYKFYQVAESDLFTEDDIDLLISLRDGLNIETFPFRKSNGEVTFLVLSANWLMHQGLAILANSKESKMFKLEEDRLFVDDKEVGYQKQCTFYISSFGEFTYGIPFSCKATKEILLLLPVGVGCRVSYLKELIPYLPLRVTSGYFRVSPFSYKEDYRNGYYCNSKLSEVPVNKILKYDNFITEIEYEIERSGRFLG